MVDKASTLGMILKGPGGFGLAPAGQAVGKFLVGNMAGHDGIVLLHDLVVLYFSVVTAAFLGKVGADSFDLAGAQQGTQLQPPVAVVNDIEYLSSRRSTID